MSADEDNQPPAELPVGVLTAMIGVPVLLALLARLR